MKSILNIDAGHAAAPFRRPARAGGSLEAALAKLGSRVLGELVTAASSDYDTARQVQHFNVDRRPAAILRAASAEDVAEAVRIARQLKLATAVRSGGHSMAGHSMVEGGIVIDLSAMRAVEVDPRTGTARVQAGARSADLAAAAQPHGLALTTGDTSSVGMGGLATGGGIGFLLRKYGLTIDNLLSARVVTADGEILRVNSDQHPDLFWALRGGGGNFGIVTEFEFQLAPVGQVLAGDLLLPASREVIRGYLEYTANAPDGLTTLANVMHALPFPFVPAENVGDLVLSVIACWTGDFEEGERAMAPLRALATPVADTIRVMPYPEIYNSTAHQAERHGWSVRSMFANELSDESIDAAIAAVESSPSPYSIVQFRGLGGAMARVGNDETAFAHRDKRYFLAAIGVWLDPAEDRAIHEAWAASFFAKVRHEGDGVYVNFLSDDGRERLGDAYPGATLDRLTEIKQRYDPTNFFRLNQNVAPLRAAA